MKEVPQKQAPEVSGGHEWPGVIDPPYEECPPFPVDYPGAPSGCTTGDNPMPD